jgi:antitoxin (DNA-binding transcriptional repressor) of toxin-antitoxin stability system
MAQVSAEDVERHPDELLARVEAGETIVIVRGDRPIAELKPIAGGRSARRPFGLSAGAFKVPPEFDDPLPDDMLDDFDGK